MTALETLVPMHPRLSRALVEEWAREAERHRLDRLWFAELRSGDPFVQVAVAQHAAPTLATGTCIASVYARSVRSIASATAVVADGHDFVLGMGVSNRDIAAWHERAWERPQESVPVKVSRIRRLLAHEPDQGGPSLWWSGTTPVPIHLAGVSGHGIRIARDCADGLLLNLVPPGPALHRALEQFGGVGDREVRCIVRCVPRTGGSGEWASWVEAEIGRYAAAPGYQQVLDASSREVGPDLVARGPEEWARINAAYAEAGVTAVSLPLVAPFEDPAAVVPAVWDAVASARADL